MGEKFYKSIYKAEKILGKAVIGITGSLLFAITVLIFTQVIFRKVFQNSLSWSEELTRYMMVWMTFLATGYALGQGAHSYMDILVSNLPGKIQFIAKKISALFLIFFSFIMLRYGAELTALGTRQKSSALRIPMNYIYLAIPLGGAIALFYSILLLIEKRREEKI